MYYLGFSDEVPFPQIERPRLAHYGCNILAADVVPVKEYETESSAGLLPLVAREECVRDSIAPSN